MAQAWAKSFYDSAAWKKQREYVLRRDHYICTEPGCHNVATEVHHIVELTEKNVNDVNVSFEKNTVKGFKLKGDIADRFADACRERGESQAAVINKVDGKLHYRRMLG